MDHPTAIRHAANPWGSLQFNSLGVRIVFELIRLEMNVISRDNRFRVVVGRNLYNVLIQARMKWLRMADSEIAGDRPPIITKIEMVNIEKKRGRFGFGLRAKFG